jgi:hypothetical protein
VDDKLRAELDALKAEIQARNAQECPAPVQVEEAPKEQPRAAQEQPTREILPDTEPRIERTPSRDPQVRLGYCDRPQPPRQVWDPHRFGR